MDWDKWITNNSDLILDCLEGVTEEITDVFSEAAGRKIEKARTHLQNPAFWMEVRSPLDGIRLLTLQLFRDGNTLGRIEFGLWVLAERNDVWGRFTKDRKFDFLGHTFPQTDRVPVGSWKSELIAEGTKVRGFSYGYNLGAMDQRDRLSLLQDVVKRFCYFVIKHYQKPQDQPTAATTTMVAGDTNSSLCKDEDAAVQEFVANLNDLTETERETLIKARVGQGSFRTMLLERWSSACSVTGLKSPNVLVASHILPWSKCKSAFQRWDINNGLLLAPALDRAFEVGYISFEHEGSQKGRIIVGKKVSWDFRDKMKLDNPQWRLREWHAGLAEYLEQHRVLWNI